MRDQRSRRRVENLSRLKEAALALTGNPDAIMDDDSAPLRPVSPRPRPRIGAHPLLGYGTGAFMKDELRSHVEFLEMVGENGASAPGSTRRRRAC